MSRRPRERPQPNDIRIELFTRFITDADAAKSSASAANSGGDSLQPHEHKAMSDDITARFRAWKARYALLLRAIEWCLPHFAENTNNTFADTIARVCTFGSTNYARFVQHNAAELMSGSQGEEDSKCDFFSQLVSSAPLDPAAAAGGGAPAAASSSPTEQACILVVWGSAADSQQQQQQQPEKKNHDDDDGDTTTQQKPAGGPPKTCSNNLRGILFRNVTAQFLDHFVSVHLMRLIVQFRIHREAPAAAASLAYFQGLTHEPMRRFSCIIASSPQEQQQQQQILIIEPLLAFRQEFVLALKRILAKAGQRQPKSTVVHVTGVVLGDTRDAVMLNSADLGNVVKDATSCAVVVKMSYPSSASTSSSSCCTTSLFDFGNGLCVQRSSLSQNGLYGEAADILTMMTTAGGGGDRQRRDVLVFTGDTVGVDSFADGVVDGNSVGRYLVDHLLVNNCNALLFPSHGGYSWVTPQLDLSWVGIAGLTKKNIFQQQQQQQPKGEEGRGEADRRSFAVMPSCPSQLVLPVASALHGAVHLWNYSHLRLNSQAATASTVALPAAAAQALPPLLTPEQLQSFYQSSASPAAAMLMKPAAASSSAAAARDRQQPPLLLDTRAPREYEQIRIAGSLSVPFTFPESERGAKKSEIWLSSLLFPGQDLIVVVSSPAHAEATVRRIRAVVPDSICKVLGLLTTEILNQPQKNSSSSNSSNKKIRFFQGPSQHFHTLPNYDAVSAALKNDGNDDADSSSSSSSVVVDCRTPTEFTQGSYIRSVNIPLSDIRNWIVWMLNPESVTHHETLSSWMNARRNEKDQAFCSSSSSSPLPRVFDILPARPALFHKSAAAAQHFLSSEMNSLAGLKKVLTMGNRIDKRTSVVVFCAGGYRSRIFMSILEAALIVQHQGQGGAEAAEGGAGAFVRVGDVGRGAVELMSQHASMWQVKDRTIMCVS